MSVLHRIIIPGILVLITAFATAVGWTTNSNDSGWTVLLVAALLLLSLNLGISIQSSSPFPVNGKQITPYPGHILFWGLSISSSIAGGVVYGVVFWGAFRFYLPLRGLEVYLGLLMGTLATLAGLRISYFTFRWYQNLPKEDKAN